MMTKSWSISMCPNSSPACLNSCIILFLSGCQDFKNGKECLHTVSPVKEGKDQISDTVSVFFQHICHKTCWRISTNLHMYTQQVNSWLVEPKLPNRYDGEVRRGRFAGFSLGCFHNTYQRESEVSGGLATLRCVQVFFLLVKVSRLRGDVSQICHLNTQ